MHKSLAPWPVREQRQKHSKEMISRALVLLTALLCSNALRPAARRRRATALRSSSSDVWQAMKVIDLRPYLLTCDKRRCVWLI